MKLGLGAALAASLILGTAAFASEEVANESHFHILSTKCEADNDIVAETAPQAPPLEIDDPDTPGCNRWEVNVTVEGDLNRLENSYQLPHLDVNYGVGDDIQLKYEAPYLLSTAPGSSQTAMGESTVGVKWEFWGSEDAGLAYGFYPQLTWVQSNSTAVQQGMATPGAIYTIPLLMTKTIARNGFGEIRMTANLGYNLSTKPDQADFVSALVGLGAPISNRTSLMGELTTDQGLSRLAGTRYELVKADVGFMSTLSRHMIVLGAVGHSLYSTDSLQHTYVLTGIRLYAGG